MPNRIVLCSRHSRVSIVERCGLGLGVNDARIHRQNSNCWRSFPLELRGFAFDRVSPEGWSRPTSKAYGQRRASGQWVTVVIPCQPISRGQQGKMQLGLLTGLPETA
jgi:hypothetical protein